MKIAIVGAGICGLYLAWKFSEKGHEVIIFEKKEKIGKEVCSGLFSERILEFIPESEKLIQNKIDFCLIHFPEKTIKLNFSGKFFVINHYDLDRLVAILTERAGAKILLKYNVTRKDLVTFQNEFDKVIGCDGANSVVRKNLRLNNPKFYLGIQGFLLENDFSNFVETWPTKDGFIWKIPRRKEMEYGIIEKPERARKIFEKFLKDYNPPTTLPLVEGERAPKNLNLERTNSAPIPQGLILPKNQRITLCGDSAGLTKPWSGGGVIWGLISANILLKNFPDFLKYQKEVKKFFLPKIIFSKMAKRLVYFFGFNFPWVFPKEFEIEGDFLV